MGVLDKFLDAIKLNDDYDDDEFLDDDLLDDEDDDDFLDDELDDKPKKKFFEKFGKKRDDDDLDDYDEFQLDEEPVRTSSKAASRSTAAAKAPAKQERPVRPASSSKITPMRSSKKNPQSPNMEVCVIKPSSMEDTREIADTLVDNSTVILNLEGIDVELAQRIIDFTSGACYSLGGSLQKVSSYIFVLGPYNVDITGDLQNILGGSIPSVRAGY
ncbi:MAG: cell division protein SepF [Eubacteriales bacterium]|nr:cell division protein SepF [Eubacteriales bacterium]